MIMPQLDKYAPYIFSAYGIAVAMLVGLAVWTFWRVGHARRKLDRIEKDGK